MASLKTTGFAIAALHTLPMLVLACVVAALGFKALDDDDDDLVRSILISVVVLCPLFSMLASGLTLSFVQDLRKRMQAMIGVAETDDIIDVDQIPKARFKEIVKLMNAIVSLKVSCQELALYVPQNVKTSIHRRSTLSATSLHASLTSSEVTSGPAQKPSSPLIEIAKSINTRPSPGAHKSRTGSYRLFQEPNTPQESSLRIRQATVMVVHIEGGFADFIETEHAKVMFTVMNYMLSLFRQHDGEVINFSF
eukprot:PhM_4_TR10009/c1_g1_i6/m.90335